MKLFEYIFTYSDKTKTFKAELVNSTPVISETKCNIRVNFHSNSTVSRKEEWAAKASLLFPRKHLGITFVPNTKKKFDISSIPDTADCYYQDWKHAKFGMYIETNNAAEAEKMAKANFGNFLGSVRAHMLANLTSINDIVDKYNA